MRMRAVAMAAGLAGMAMLASCTEAGPQERQQLQKGFDQYQAQRYSAAEAAATEYITKFPQDPAVDEAYYLRGVSKMGRSDKGGAAADLHLAIEKSKRADLKAKAYRALGEMAFTSDRFEQAIDYYNKALQNYPQAKPDALALYRIGASLQAIGRWDEARGYFQRVIDLRSDPTLVQRSANRKDLRGYALQFGAYANEKAARDLAAALKSAGINATIVREMGDQAVLFIVRAGQYRTFAEADYARAQYIKRYPMVRVSP